MSKPKTDAGVLPVISRRGVLRGGAAGSIAIGASSATLATPAAAAGAGESGKIALDTMRSRHWIGPDFWSNRFQDWHLRDGVIECLTGAQGDELRTLGILTREIGKGGEDFQLSAHFQPLTGADEPGFGGFLIGIGAGQLDYRAAALAQRGGGTNGGFMAVVDTMGQVSFRDHSSNTAEPLEYEFQRVDRSGGGVPAFVPGGVRLLVEARHHKAGFEVTATAYDAVSGEPLSFARRVGLRESDVLGGLSLLSSPQVGQAGARWSIRDVAFTGSKIAHHPERALGPVMGAMHSLTGSILKVSAQFMPIGEGDPSEAVFEYRTSGSEEAWRVGAASAVHDGYVALFRLEDWDGSRDWDYQIRYAQEPGTLWSGTIRREPDGKSDVSAALYSCISSTAHSLEGGETKTALPRERDIGRFTPENFYFPHTSLSTNTAAHDPDILLVCGDQYYEHNPIRLGRHIPETRKLDTLYRWYLWYWSFRDLTRDRPTIVLIDDHDVLHGNIWGHAGRDAPDNQQNNGGYAWGADLTRMVHQVQCWHNPDAYDPTPVLNDIPVYYTAFLYGGVSFALVEDRKWKTTPMYGDNLNVHVAELLGERQESFLAEWKDMHPGAPKMLVTASVWGCPQTSPDGRPVTDFDSNGYPALARRKAVELVKETGAVMVAGDQHLATLLRHGIDEFDDGPFQFSGPAGASYWQRWFDPLEPLPNQRDRRIETGDFIDAFGNKMHMLAAANPKITFAEFREHISERSQAVHDPALKSEGYGIIRVSHKQRAFTFECWDKTTDPNAPGANQYPGWPYTVRFDQT